MDEKTPDSGMKRPGGKPSAGEPPNGKPSGGEPSNGGSPSGGPAGDKLPGDVPPPSIDDEQARLVQQVARDYGAELLTLTTRLVGGTHAEGVAKEAFAKLTQRLVQRPLPEVMALLRSPTDLRKLMYRITACRAFEHLHRHQNLTGALTDDCADIEVVEANVPQRLPATLDVERVEHAYASLSPAQRIAHVLHYYYEFTEADFQLTLGLSKTDSRTLVSRATRALRRALEMKS